MKSRREKQNQKRTCERISKSGTTDKEVHRENAKVKGLRTREVTKDTY